MIPDQCEPVHIWEKLATRTILRGATKTGATFELSARDDGMFVYSANAEGWAVAGSARTRQEAEATIREYLRLREAA